MILWTIFKSALDKWNKDRVATMAAAISYYTIFAIGPSLLVFLYFIGIFYSDSYARDRLISQVYQVGGGELAVALDNLISAVQSTQGQGPAGFIGFILLFFTAFSLINEIRMSLITIWETRPTEFNLKEFLKGFSRNIIALVTVGVFWIIYILVGDGFNGIGQFFDIMSITALITPFFQIFVTTLFLFILLKVLIYSRIPSKPLLVGSFITSFLLHLSFVALSYYIGVMFRNPFYGAAGTVVLTLFWIYLCAQIYLFGVCLTWSICTTHKNIIDETV